MAGLPAARIGDPTVHGGIVTVGCPTVIIGGKPASRIGDMHTCPMVTVLVPHVGGPFVLGSFTVIVGGSPQSRQTDMLICIGPPDALLMGCPTVLVGMVGGMGGVSAILGGLLAGLINFLAGYPRVVQKPDGTTVTEYNSFITIEGTPEFQAKAVRDLNQIASTPSGKKLLASIQASGKQCRIHIDSEPNGTPGNWAWTDPPSSGPNAPGLFKSDGSAGPKANAEIGYDPDLTSISGPPNSPYNKANWAQSPNCPSDVGLFHEMVHADDIMHGRANMTNVMNVGPVADPDNLVRSAELRASGLPPYDNSDYSENTYRTDRGLPNRTFY